ncbi:hypothetical protein Kpol_1050p58 [Vanderwaltozyma polyspora DSM 70294]|uniref:Maintenance of telomere capping protein 6 n=1 Tax=Vanderwaltozyma polyspora (strain ATCC 22028 / DSM 70294 / BCRC 21397 / CBS 2163 / NBRC 10782 / NRRL Y-8283 / UCD 57-17) TaxID=436907 RepID=MTC6_VANPO|nr:uncharacterized protein Kpol_1050p58 [Vanderwaltozyma polyspora DSM 70294]A7TEV4.1 RecName: Full=Maintenance of telomere capping protein 6; Flags: Precursor [Vanderwaltozyma polyspora DSM 70294]EDO19200.1 hypothetical protein Kpol_1050p58 [Vanderwaltozyma polyspora DSM 70294]
MIVMQLQQQLLIWVIFWLNYATALTNFTWSSDSPSMVYALRAQRDVMSSATIDQLPLVGVDVGRVFINGMVIENKDEDEEDEDLLVMLESLLEAGVQALSVDVEYKDEIWVVGNSTIAFDDFLLTVRDFLDGTNTDLSANILMVMLRIQPNSSDYGSPSTFNNYTHGYNYSDISDYNKDDIGDASDIEALIYSNIGRSYIYSPEDLVDDRNKSYTSDIYGLNSVNGWPTLSHFLYQKRKRVLFTELTTEMPYNTSSLLFNKTILHLDGGNIAISCPTSNSELTELSLVAWRFIENEFTDDSVRSYVDCGYSPIIANKYNQNNITHLLNLTQSALLWSWEVGQPSTNEKKNSDTLEAYNCVSFVYTANNYSAYWKVENCYDEKKGLCEAKTDLFSYIVSENVDSYFNFDSFDGSNCPDGFDFSIPKTPLEQLAVINYLRLRNSSDTEIWIDLNSISVNNCWVTGGPYATCPYETVMSRRNFTKMITPASITSFGLLVLVTCLNLLSLPIHDNRSNWRRMINKLSRNEFDGVPA